MAFMWEGLKSKPDPLHCGSAGLFWYLSRKV